MMQIEFKTINLLILHFKLFNYNVWAKLIVLLNIEDIYAYDLFCYYNENLNYTS